MAFAQGETTTQFSREMGLTHADFFRTLPAAMGELPYQVNGLQVVSQQANKLLNIQLGSQQQRRIALLSIPYVAIDFCFRGYQAAEVKAFMQRFDSYFQRGGG